MLIEKVRAYISNFCYAEIMNMDLLSVVTTLSIYHYQTNLHEEKSTHVRLKKHQVFQEFQLNSSHYFVLNIFMINNKSFLQTLILNIQTSIFVQKHSPRPLAFILIWFFPPVFNVFFNYLFTTSCFSLNTLSSTHLSN